MSGPSEVLPRQTSAAGVSVLPRQTSAAGVSVLPRQTSAAGVSAEAAAGRREQTAAAPTPPYQHEILEPMWLVGLHELEAFGRLPRSSDRAAAGAVALSSLSDAQRAASLIVFVSHRWMMASLDPGKAHPDTPDNLKHALLVEGLKRLASGLPAGTQRVLVWVDWLGMDQDDLPALRRGMSSLSGYIERSDALFTPYTDEFEARRAGDDKATLAAAAADGGGCDGGGGIGGGALLDEATRSFLSVAAAEPSLAIFSRHVSLAEYLSRGWCRLEVFMAANSPLPTPGYGYFARCCCCGGGGGGGGGFVRTDRPHFFFGDWQAPKSELPEVGPRIANSVLTLLAPAAGAVTVASDRQVLAALVAAFPVPLLQRESYDGGTNGAGLPHGEGKKVYADNRVYEGGWADGEYEGEGSLLYANGTLYKGAFRRGVRHGRGVHCLSNGLRFEGSFDGGDSHGGPARLYAQSGLLKVEGQKVRTKWEGAGYVEYHPSGAVCFRGSARDNARHGPGVEFADDGAAVGEEGAVLRRGRWDAGAFVAAEAGRETRRGAECEEESDGCSATVHLLDAR